MQNIFTEPQSENLALLNYNLLCTNTSYMKLKKLPFIIEELSFQTTSIEIKIRPTV